MLNSTLKGGVLSYSHAQISELTVNVARSIQPFSATADRGHHEAGRLCFIFNSELEGE